MFRASDEVTLDLDAEFKLLGATSSNGIPVVANTQYQSKVDVMTGEWAVLSGLMTSQEAKTITGLPILSYIPLLRQQHHHQGSGRDADRAEAARDHCSAIG